MEAPNIGSKKTYRSVLLDSPPVRPVPTEIKKPAIKSAPVPVPKLEPGEKISVAITIPHEFITRQMPPDQYQYMNLMMNMMGGLSPDDLSGDEIDLLQHFHGPNWREALDILLERNSIDRGRLVQS